MLPPEFRIYPLGENFLVVEGPSVIEDELSDYLHQFASFLKRQLSDFIFNINTTYNSVCLQYHSTKISQALISGKILAQQKQFNYQKRTTIRCWEIPVCYHPTLAPDLAAFCKIKKTTTAEIISLHTEPRYKIYFLGFLPGFPYLGGLDRRLHTPRKIQPRQKVPAGSVGIGGHQTGIYPHAAPGGWWLIGRSPVSFFDPRLDPPVLLQAGDYLRFKSIGLKKYYALVKKFSSSTEQSVPAIIE